LAGVQNNVASAAAGVLLGAVLLWEVALRGQMGFAISFLEEVWSRNLGHIFVSPLRPGEFVAALMAMSVLRTLVAVVPAMVLAWIFYGFGILQMGPVIVAFFALLLAMGWAVALLVTSLILRHGAGAEALAWGVLFGVTPFAAVFYPVSILPGAVQWIAFVVPASHVFEDMRAVLLEGRIAWDQLAWAAVLNAAWLALGAWVFLREFQAARVRGALLNVGE
ncbi:MAG TPA: ABC transporter permease, partial [Acetobacteraceae bacterium]|nr:ABC transporter permease [Acetobacteraceae bacterium]